MSKGRGSPDVNAPEAGRDPAGASPAAPSDFVIRRATGRDATAIATLVQDAFATEIATYGPDLPPLRETAAVVRAALERGIVLVAERDGCIIGSVRGELADDGTCLVSRLVVLPEVRRLGAARVLTVELEHQFPGTSRFELFTGHLSAGALALYESLGYRRFREEVVSPSVTLVYLEKSV